MIGLAKVHEGVRELDTVVEVRHMLAITAGRFHEECPSIYKYVRVKNLFFAPTINFDPDFRLGSC